MSEQAAARDSDIAPLMAASQPAPSSSPAKTQKHKKTAGEVIFDRTVYTGIGFGVNEASSLWITDQFLHGRNLFRRGPQWLQKAGKWFSEEGFKTLQDGIVQKHNTTPAKAETGILMVTLLSGGTLLILPMRWLENSKAYWVKKANHFADMFSRNKNKEEIAARDAEVEQVVACSPKQSWSSLLLGRVIACTASVCTGMFIMGKKRNDRIQDFSESVITDTMKSTNKLFAGSDHSKLAKLADNNIFRRYARLTGVETYSCAISSIVLEIASKFLAKRKPYVNNPKLCAAANAAGEIEDSTGDFPAEGLPKNIKALAQKQPMTHTQRIESEPAQPVQQGVA